MVVDEKTECLMISVWVDVRPAKIGMGYRQSRARVDSNQGCGKGTYPTDRAVLRGCPSFYGYADFSLGS